MLKEHNDTERAITPWLETEHRPLMHLVIWCNELVHLLIGISLTITQLMLADSLPELRLIMRRGLWFHFRAHG